jgi:riboflavin kinase / FMN adenylyltransferase
MKIYNHIDEFKAIKNAVVTIGTFDGVHIGHQKILGRLREIAHQTRGEAVILTFFPHPRMILHPEDQNLKLITTMSEKAQLLEQAGINHLIITPFTRDFSNLSAEEYIKKVLVEKIGTKKIVIGYDHRFGKDRAGTLKDLQALSGIYNYEVEEIPEQDVNDVAVSSTQIRSALLSGDVSAANAFLGYTFTLTGKVVRGDQLGRTLGYPTANLFIEENYKLIPGDGIYAVQVQIHENPGSIKHQFLKGMGYIGARPTINGMSRKIEVNIFDFNDDIYNQKITIHFLYFVRHDEKFASLDDLKQQLHKDKIKTLELIA